MTISTTDTPEAEALRVTIDRQMLDYRTATTCIVTAISSDGTTVDVQPAIPMTRRVEGVQSVDLPPISGVPIAMFGSTSQGLFVVPPISVGDDGMLIISDRALDNWQFGEGVQPAPDAETPRHHDLTDAMFYPGVQRKSGAIVAMPTDAIQLRNRSGEAAVSVSNGYVRAEMPGASIVVTPGNIDINGMLTINGVPFLAHAHSGVQVGPDNTGGVSS